MRVAVSIGHTPKRFGASYKQYKEHFEASLIAAYLGQELSMRNIEIVWVPNELSLRGRVAFVNKEHIKNPIDVFIEVHLNAASNKKAHGSETLYYPFSKKGKKLAELVEKHMGTMMRSRGAKQGWFRGIKGGKLLYILKATKPVAIITESFFIHDTEEWKGDYPKIAKMIANGIQDFIKPK